MYDEFYTALENGRIEPITYWKDVVSKWDEMTQTQFYIGLIGKIAKEEREGRYYSPMHRYASHLANVISQQSNIQRQTEKEQQAQLTDANEQHTHSIDINEQQIPVELQSKDAQRILGWLVGGGFLTELYCPTDKLKTKRKLAYLCYNMSKALNLGKNNRGNNQKDISWQPFERLFNTTGLGNNFNQLMREHNYDIKGLYPDIDTFFD